MRSTSNKHFKHFTIEILKSIPSQESTSLTAIPNKEPKLSLNSNDNPKQ